MLGFSSTVFSDRKVNLVGTLRGSNKKCHSSFSKSADKNGNYRTLKEKTVECRY